MKVFFLLSTVLLLSCTPSLRYHSVTMRSSDTILEIQAKSKKSVFSKSISQIKNEIERIDLIINPYNKKSEIAKINRLSEEGESEFLLSPTLAYLIGEGLYFSSVCRGFDITIEPYIKLWGFGYTNRVPSGEEIEKAGKRIGIENVFLSGRKMRLARSVSFDFGSYGKGYILDNIKTIMLSNGVSNFLVNFGGDIILMGKNSRNTPWVVGVKHPREGGVYFTVSLTNDSIVTSGDYERFFIEDNIRYHHIIDASTGFPADASISSTIVANTGLKADGLSTIAFIEGTNFLNEGYDYKQAFIVIEDREEGKIELYAKTNR